MYKHPDSANLNFEQKIHEADDDIKTAANPGLRISRARLGEESWNTREKTIKNLHQPCNLFIDAATLFLIFTVLSN